MIFVLFQTKRNYFDLLNIVVCQNIKNVPSDTHMRYEGLMKFRQSNRENHLKKYFLYCGIHAFLHNLLDCAKCAEF